MTDYGSLYGGWRDDPTGYWGTQASRIQWDQPWTEEFDNDTGPYGRWFPGARLNTSYNCLDRHVDAGAGDRPALVWDSAMTGEVVTHTYRELRDRVAKVAGALSAVGVNRGDRVVIYMPMVPEAAIAMLACARLGAVHSVVFGGFAASELAARIDATEPRAIIAGSCGLEPGRVVEYKPVLDDALAQSRHRPEACFILQRPQALAELEPGRDHDLLVAEAAATPHDAVPVEASDPLYILHTSGTTGRPKGIVRDNGGHAVALAASIPTIFGLTAGDTFWAASDVGWVVGHSYIVYAPLLAGLTSVMYEGKPVGTPDAGAFWRVIEQHRVNVLFTAPTAIRGIRRQDPDLALLGRHDVSSLQAVFLAGERCDPPTATWLQWAGRRPDGAGAVGARRRGRRVDGDGGRSRRNCAPSDVRLVAVAASISCEAWLSIPDTAGGQSLWAPGVRDGDLDDERLAGAGLEHLAHLLHALPRERPSGIGFCRPGRRACTRSTRGPVRRGQVLAPRPWRR